MPDPETATVMLRGGVEVPLGAVRLALDLEARGIALRIDGDALIVRPRSALSDDEVVLIRRHQAALKRIAMYEAPTL